MYLQIWIIIKSTFITTHFLLSFQEISAYTRQKPAFFVDGSTRFDVKQGSLGKWCESLYRFQCDLVYHLYLQCPQICAVFHVGSRSTHCFTSMYKRELIY